MTELHGIETSDYQALLPAEIFVSLRLSAIDPKPDVDRLATKHNLPAIHIRNKFDDQLTPQHDWLTVAREIVTVLYAARNAGAERIHLCMTGPVPLAFAIGMGLGHQLPVTVYQWFRSERTYHPVLALEML